MRKQTKAALATARVEKDVENAYRAEVSALRHDAEWTSPHGTDGHATWDVPGNATTVRLLLEAKYDHDLKSKLPVCNVLGQLILYLKKFEQAGEVMPNVLLVGDRDECFVLSTDAVRGFLSLDLDWSAAPSKGSPELTRALVQGFNLLPYVYDVDGNLDFKDVLAKVETLAKGAKHQARATTGNLGAIFLYWRDRVFGGGKDALTPTEQVDVFLRCLFQPGDVYLHPTKRGVLVVPGYPAGVVVNAESYRSFFDHFAQGYKPSEIESFYAMKDRLVEDDARRRQGAFFTPRLWVDEAHKELDRVLGPKWREECVVWDPAAGTANLTRDYNDWGCLISSTAERPDVQVMKEQGWGGKWVFQYDFLNPGTDSPFFESDGKNQIPDEVDGVLRALAKSGKRLVFLMNPPYAEDGVAGASGETRKGVALTDTNKDMGKLGRANRQLYAQFMYRCSAVAREYGFKDSTVGIFCKPTFMSSGSYRPFRDWWYNRHAYVGGFLFQASHFADVSGTWGISFTVWNSGGKTDKAATLPITLKDEVAFAVTSIGLKGIYNSDDNDASEWVFGAEKGTITYPFPILTSGLRAIPEEQPHQGRWCEGALYQMANKGNNLMKSGTDVYMLSGKVSQRIGVAVLPDNWRRAVALYGARKLVTGDWINDKDEYLRPDESKSGYGQWVDDCHVYALLHHSNNCTAMRDVAYKGKAWRIKNQWFWRTRKDTLKALDTAETPTLYRDCKAEPVKSRDTSDVLGTLVGDKSWEQTGDAYFAYVLPSLNLSPDARKVLDLLDALWVKSLPVRESYAAGKPELHLMAYDAGVYQLKHLWRDLFPEDWKVLQDAFHALEGRLRDGVYEYGFLRR